MRDDEQGDQLRQFCDMVTSDIRLAICRATITLFFVIVALIILLLSDFAYRAYDSLRQPDISQTHYQIKNPIDLQKSLQAG
jgi:hypothetical protein